VVRIQCGEPVVFVPDFSYLTDSITRAQEILPGTTQWISEASKDSNPLRDRDRHQFGTLIAIPRKPQALIRRAVQINTSASGRTYPLTLDLLPYVTNAFAAKAFPTLFGVDRFYYRLTDCGWTGTTMWITWKHRDSDFSWPPPFEEKVEIFYHRTLGWQLHIADLLANGGQPLGESTTVQHLRHSGFAVLQICLSYFETIGQYEQEKLATKTSTEYFKEGVRSIFPQLLARHGKAVEVCIRPANPCADPRAVAIEGRNSVRRRCSERPATDRAGDRRAD
jgi:hypothetical protein